MKLLLLVLPLLLLGCGTVPKTLEVVPEPVVVVEPVISTPEPVVVSAPAPVAASKPTIVEKIAEVTKTIESGKVKLNKAKEVVNSIKSVVNAAKEVKAQVEDFNKDIDMRGQVPTPPEAPAPSTQIATAPPYDYRTGAKIQFLGIDLEFWLGQNDSWNTVFKMLTLLLVTYGGFRGINYMFSKKTVTA